MNRIWDWFTSLNRDDQGYVYSTLLLAVVVVVGAALFTVYSTVALFAPYGIGK